jgi:hypothetical protein
VARVQVIENDPALLANLTRMLRLEEFEAGKRASERDYLVTLLKQTQGNVTQAAQLATRTPASSIRCCTVTISIPRLFKTPRE